VDSRFQLQLLEEDGCGSTKQHPMETSGLWTTGDHCVGKVSATGQLTRPTQPFILSWSINE